MTKLGNPRRVSSKTWNKFVKIILNYRELPQLELEFTEIYCDNCKQVLGTYNKEFYSESKIGEVIKIIYASHIREGHNLVFKNIKNK